MEVLFTFLAERYERRSVLLSRNLVFSKMGPDLKDAMTKWRRLTRLVHHAIILEFNERACECQKKKEKGAANPTRPQPLRLRFVFGA